MEGWKQRLIDGSVIVAFLGLAFVLGGVTLWFLELRPAADAVNTALFDLIMHVLFGGVILVLGVHIERSRFPPKERFEVIAWCYGGFALMVILSVLGHLDAILNGTLTPAFVSDFVVFSSLGGAFGIIAGLNSRRAIRNETLAERNKEQSETLALLTRVMSHDIRNSMTIIRSYTGRLNEQVTGEAQSDIDSIQERSDETVRLLEDISALVESLETEKEFERIDLSAVLNEEVATIRSEYPDVDVQTDIQPAIHVEADQIIHQLFANLLQNAVVHNEEDDLRIDVQLTRVEDDIVVTISDNGHGIEPEMRETLFELGEQGQESDGDGMGLYLVSRLANSYGGAVEVGESPDGGARFRIELPAPASSD
jgi:two-component system OmpR family sensor kinase